MSPAPNKITAAGNGTAVNLVKEPSTKLPFANVSRHWLLAKEFRLGGAVGRLTLLKTFPLGSVSDTSNNVGKVPLIAVADDIDANVVILSMPPPGALFVRMTPLAPEDFAAL